jgi:hypothetical protein
MAFQQLRSEESTPHSLPHFDNETVRQVLLRASAIQEQRQQASLSVAQIEALGNELGIAPEAVRQALGELTNAPSVASVSSAPIHSETLPLMTVAQMITTPIPGLLYGLFLSYFVRTANSTLGIPDPAPYLVALTYAAIFVFPALIAFGSGWLRRDLRAGAIVGAFLTVLPLSTVFLTIGLLTGDWRGYGALEQPWITGMLLSCVSLGALGGWLSKRSATEQAEKQRQRSR